jgi:prevent-host-death family protein
MHTWKLKNAQHRLRELVRLALTKEPQRLSNGKDAVVVIAASEYDRLVARAPKRPEVHLPGAEGSTAPPVPVEPARPGEGGSRKSAWDSIAEWRSKHDLDEVGWPFEWDCETRDWYLPGERALSP